MFGSLSTSHLLRVRRKTKNLYLEAAKDLRTSSSVRLRCSSLQYGSEGVGGGEMK